MSVRIFRTRILSPLERFSEIVFGLIMVLSVTGTISVQNAGQYDTRALLAGAIGCNLAWGIIDAAFYLIACLTEHRHNIMLLRRAQQCTDPPRVREMIVGVLPSKIAEALQSADFERIHTHLKRLPQPASSFGLTWENWLGSLVVFFLVVLSTLPVVVPFMFIHNRLALHVSNAVAIALLFGAGYMLAGYAGMHRIVTGLAMVAIGAALVGLTIALGG
jgi:hypothetical protein